MFFSASGYTPEIPREFVVGSNICGSVSVACWVFLLLPQLIEQYRLKSADGIAIGFITLWMIGDIANLLGAVIGHLRPNVSLLALWFCFSDSLLVLSYIYYTHKSRLQKMLEETNEDTPLLPGPAESELDHTHHHHHHHAHHAPWWLSTGLPLVFVFLVSAGSYMLSDSTPDDGPEEKPLVAEVLGYFSAAMYLFARIPQIIQNHRRRSVEGLSMGFFLLSMLGNLTYSGQILILRQDKEWIMLYLPWLLGSVGTVFEDLVIFGQFYLYDDDDEIDDE
ncbi:putative vacuolar amino acid transporter YPQ3 [Wickerhamiella sorbophila]|uniref:Putative vacuolar amino acid transporter YPQ3 n=1 Tax=Wickerhamiella sorbophila TaxID=45607 RepID=A0A2T0FEV3_9ASCO|nr:putative vacuolar amino acid transporter YPQ3 [Wickerhamiella sorbophila]PRT53521.1 putative vacuolar amino acid transporter YPQ3 [Wickerhamiella sorbophila]